ncbi:MAG: GntR family transcriptional regulator [Burkholderiaceae bacterium]
MKASDRIRSEIERAIRDAELLPGEPIDEAELARKHSVSRTPIREALLQLEAQGLVTSMPRSGMLVAKMNLQQLLALWELLGELEGVAVRLACQRMSADERQALIEHHERSATIVAQEDIAGWQQSNLDFHELIYKGTRNPYLRQEVLRIRTRTGYYRRHAFAAMGHIKTSFEQHAAIIAAVRANDCNAAAAAMIAHMRPAQDAKALTEFIVNLPGEVLAS